LLISLRLVEGNAMSAIIPCYSAIINRVGNLTGKMHIPERCFGKHNLITRLYLK